MIGLLRKQGIYQIEGQEVSAISLDTFDIERLEVSPILFQTGYLTIQSQEDGIFVLDYPNQEVKQSFLQYLLQDYRQGSLGEGLPIVVRLRTALQNNDLSTAIEVINTVFSTLPYDLWQNENERFYHALIHLTFTLLGVYVHSEVHTSRGRCDALVQTQKHVYAFEFKLDKTAQEALNQIIAKGYLTPYKHSGKTLVSVGMWGSIFPLHSKPWKVGWWSHHPSIKTQSPPLRSCPRACRRRLRRVGLRRRFW